MRPICFASSCIYFSLDSLRMAYVALSARAKAKMPEYCWGRAYSGSFCTFPSPGSYQQSGMTSVSCVANLPSLCTDGLTRPFSDVQARKYSTRLSMHTAIDQAMLTGTPCLGTLTLRHISRSHIVARGQDILNKQSVCFSSAIHQHQQLELSRDSRHRWSCCRASQQPSSDASDVPLGNRQEAASSTSAIAQKDM